MPSNKIFGLFLAILLFIFGVFPITQNSNANFLLIVLSLITAISSFIFPNIFFILNKLWYEFGKMLSIFMSPIFITIIYFITILPISIIMRILGKNLLNLKRDKNANSYWQTANEENDSFKEQF